MTTTEQFARLLWDRMVNLETAYTFMWSYDDKQGYSKPVESVCGRTAPCPQCNKYGKCSETKDKPLLFEDMIEHVKGTTTLAPYQLSHENSVKYLELDVDIVKGSSKTIEDAQTQVLSLVKVIASMFGPYSCMVEISGSKGYHIWMFFADQIAARFAYALGHFIVDQIEAIDGIDVEVFPKQVTQTSYGSATRLPFGIHRKTGVRGLIVDKTFTPHDDQFAAFQRVRDITEDEVFETIRTHQIQVPDSIRRDAGKGYLAFLCIQRLMQEGAEEGHRDILMYRLACYLRERGFDYDMAAMVLQNVNTRGQAPLDERTVASKLDSAYKADYSGMPCFIREFDSYCSSRCPIFEKKAAWRKMSVEELKRIVRD